MTSPSFGRDAIQELYSYRTRKGRIAVLKSRMMGVFAGAASFGIWQGSFAAAVFMACFLEILTEIGSLAIARTQSEGRKDESQDA